MKFDLFCFLKHYILTRLFLKCRASILIVSFSLFQYSMGKNKGGKNKQNPVFRVAGGKAAKAKAKFKAQPVNTNLKKVLLVKRDRKIEITQTFLFPINS